VTGTKREQAGSLLRRCYGRRFVAALRKSACRVVSSSSAIMWRLRLQKGGCCILSRPSQTVNPQNRRIVNVIRGESKNVGAIYRQEGQSD
jgi:hypothetical protein